MKLILAAITLAALMVGCAINSGGNYDNTTGANSGSSPGTIAPASGPGTGADMPSNPPGL